MCYVAVIAVLYCVTFIVALSAEQTKFLLVESMQDSVSIGDYQHGVITPYSLFTSVLRLNIGLGCMRHLQAEEILHWVCYTGSEFV